MLWLSFKQQTVYLFLLTVLWRVYRYTLTRLRTTKKNLFIIRGLLHKHRACISNNCYIPTAPFCSHTRSRHPNLHLIITSSNPVIRSVPNVLYSNLRNLTLNRSGPLCPSYNLLFTFHGPKYFRLDTTMTYLKPIPSQEYYLPFIIFDW